MLGPNDSVLELSDERLITELTEAKSRVERIAQGGTSETSAVSARSWLGQLEFEAICRGIAPPVQASPAAQ